MKVFVFAEDGWSIGRVHHDVARSLPDIEFIFSSWFSYDWQSVIDNFNNADVCLTGILSVQFFKSSFPSFNLKKCLFVSHGLEYNVNNHLEDSDLTYSMTSTSIRHYFPEKTTVFLTPNGVDPANFTHTIRDGSLNTIGWCGAPHITSKNIHWAVQIAARANITFSISSKVPCESDIFQWKPLNYDEVRAWYGTIDLLIITAEPSMGSETGPLPAFEAIVSGIPVVGTPVGNFASIPGPKFQTIEEGVEIVNDLKLNPEKMKALAKEQYAYVMEHYTYESFADKWREAIEYVHSLR